MSFEKQNIKNLKMSQKESSERKKDDLALIKEILQEKFGKERLPENLVEEMVYIRREIKSEIEKENFVDSLSEAIDNRIRFLMVKIYNTSFKDEEIEEITEDGSGEIEISFKDGKKEILSQKEKELLFSLRLYFDSYRLVKNASKFRNNVDETKSRIIRGNNDRVINFYSEKDKHEELISGLKEKYEEVGFSGEELKELIKICDLKDLDNLPIHKIKIMGKIKDIFSRFIGGDKAMYVGLSAALMVPAFIQGRTPTLFAEAFKSNVDSMDALQHIVLYAIASVGSSGLSLFIHKFYKDFTNKNYQKEGGISEFTAKNLTKMSPDETQKFGLETVKRRAEKGRNSYESVLNTLGFDILPAVTTLATTATMLYKESPVLAGGTAVASGITIALNHYFQKVGKFSKKQRDSERTSEQMAQKLDEQLSAHMEIILAGENEKFFNEVKDFIEKEKIADSNRNFFEIFEEASYGFSHAVNFTLLGIASMLTGGSPDKTIAAILSSNNFTQGIQELMKTKRRILESLRNVMQMELMFNGYAEGEEEKEKDRVDVDQTEGSDINLKDVNVELGGNKILDNLNLDIPSGSMVYLEGASGAGKTTLMKILCGYYHPNSGEVKFGGMNVENIKKTGEGSIYRRIAYLSQFPYLFEDSLKNNLKFGLKNEISDDKIKAVLKEVGLHDRFKDLNEKLFGGSGDSGKTSGGETSRIGLARVLLRIRNSDSKLVFLDEPTASVDKATKKDIARIINEEKAKRPETTFVVISHDEKFVEMLNCTIEVRMKKGKITARHEKVDDDYSI